MIRAVIIDDDEMTRQVLQKYIERTSGIVLSAEFPTAVEALSALKEQNIDLFFLDVEMPEMDGFDFLKYINNRVAEVVMITSKDKYAVQAFDYDVADYLVKPIDYKRFIQAVKKVKDHLGQQLSHSDNFDSIYYKEDQVFKRVELDHVNWVEAAGDYVTISTDEKNHLAHTTMKQIELHLPNHIFTRIHRSYIVNTNKIKNFDKEFCVINQKMIPIGKSYRKELMQRLNVL